jgi:hypothetical protein
MLTFWPWPNRDFGGGNDCVREIQVDDNGDGMTDRRVTIAMPILHFLGLVSGMSGDFQVLPERVVGPHVVSGFASQQGGVTRILLYAHSALDTESRSAHAFRITLGLTGLAHGAVTVREYRFDKDHNSYFRLARPLRDADGAAAPPADAAARLERAVAALTTGGRASRRAALDDLAALGPAAASAAGAMLEFAQKSDDAGLRARAMRALERVTGSPPCSGKVARQLEERAALHTTGSATRPVGADGQLSLEIDLDANGANFLEIEPSGRPR